MTSELVIPDWPAPENVKAVITTRDGGVSSGRYSSFNLATHVGDSPDAVSKNRESLKRSIEHEVTWLAQVHGTHTIRANHGFETPPEADAIVSFDSCSPCAVLTADCLPVLICDMHGEVVAAVHAGWRGLADGVLDSAVKAMGIDNRVMMAYIGPAISKRFFEVGQDVVDYFVAQGWCDVERHCSPSSIAPDKYYMDLSALAKQRLVALGINHVYGGSDCTFADSRFYSYRRDGDTGRFASVIWFE